MLVKPCIILVTSKTFLELCTFGFSVLSLTNTETIKEQISMVIKKEANKRLTNVFPQHIADLKLLVGSLGGLQG